MNMRIASALLLLSAAAIGSPPALADTYPSRPIKLIVPFSAGGPPFFGLLFDATQSYSLSFSIFIGMLFASALLSLFLKPPSK